MPPKCGSLSPVSSSLKPWDQNASIPCNPAEGEGQGGTLSESRQSWAEGGWRMLISMNIKHPGYQGGVQITLSFLP